MAIVDGYCEQTDLPPEMCAHCRQHEFEFPDMDEQMAKVTGHGTMRRVKRVEVSASDLRVAVGRLHAAGRKQDIIVVNFDGI